MTLKDVRASLAKWLMNIYWAKVLESTGPIVRYRSHHFSNYEELSRFESIFADKPQDAEPTGRNRQP